MRGRIRESGLYVKLNLHTPYCVWRLVAEFLDETGVWAEVFWRAFEGWVVEKGKMDRISIHIFTSSVPMVVFMGMECSGLRLVLRQSNWRRSSGTKSSRCFFAKERSHKISSKCSCHGAIRVSMSSVDQG